MRALSASELLGTWEQGLSRPPFQRALTLLAAACPETADTLAEFSLGQRDACLLTLREWTFGPQLVSLAVCPNCGERLELTFDVADLRVVSESEPGGILSFSRDGYEVHFRLPTCHDLAEAGGHDVAAARSGLLEQCLLAVYYQGEERPASELSDSIVEAVVEQMAQADPQAEVQLNLSCPVCGHCWPAIFDIEAYFWSEINAWAYRCLRDVHRLASAYGWREADILALNQGRRQFYLDMITG